VAPDRTLIERTGEWQVRIVREGRAAALASTVLIVDDDPQLRAMLADALRQESFAVEEAASGEETLEMVEHHEPDVVLLDVLMPGLGGLETCRRIRARSEVPIIMLTALGREEFVVAGLQAGADHFCTKPVSPAQLAARIRALLRRRDLDAASARSLVSVQAGDLVVDPAARQAIVRGRAVDLSPREFGLLERLARSPGRLVSHEELLQHVWGSTNPEYLGHLRSYIKLLRQKVEPDPHHPRYIRSRPGLGYMLGERSQDPVPADAVEVAPARRD
jgi:DNA-binding response OmpR family regulator